MLTTWGNLRWDYWRPSGGGYGHKPTETWGETALKEHLHTITASYKTEAPALTPVFAYYGASRGHIDVPERLRSAKNNYEYPTSALVDCFNPRSNFREMLAWFDQEQADELSENKGVVAQEYAPWASLEAVRATVVSLLGGDYKNPHFKRRKFMLERASDGAELLVNQLSQGYQSMLALAMDFARRLAIANPHLEYGNIFAHQQLLMEVSSVLEGQDPATYEPFQHALTMSAPAIMLVDEIDLHLHPSWQQRVLGDLMRTFPLTQFIVTTHSPLVLATVPSDSVRILRGNQVFEAPAGIEGAEPGRILTTAQGLKSERPPENEATKELLEYLALVDQDKWNTPQALEIRQKLDARYQGNEPALLEADLLIENRKWELGE
jgi:predicted ATP-binding protein involved in virulence